MRLLALLTLASLSTVACTLTTTTARPGVAGAGGAVQNTPADAPQLPCQQQAREVHGNAGTSWYVRCPSGCGDGGSVWGTDIYTDDSRVCAAALHAGRMGAEGGVVLVTWVDSTPFHVGSTRNGVTSSDYGVWGRDFYVQSVDAEGKPTSAPPTFDATVKLSATCTTSGDAVGTKPGDQRKVSCPADCTHGNVWGSGPYTADSNVCVAAVHAGVVGPQGGAITVTIGGRLESFAGSARNGVTTEAFGPYERTFTVAP